MTVHELLNTLGNSPSASTASAIENLDEWTPGVWKAVVDLYRRGPIYPAHFSALANDIVRREPPSGTGGPTATAEAAEALEYIRLMGLNVNITLNEPAVARAIRRYFGVTAESCLIAARNLSPKR